jgi:hypothetical protein
MMANMGPFRDDTLEYALQMSAQSKHKRMHSFIAAFPAATSSRHSTTQAKQLALQSVHPGPQISGSAPRTFSPTPTNPAAKTAADDPNILRRSIMLSIFEMESAVELTFSTLG